MFLRLLGYNRKFIRNFAKITKPLNTYLKQHAKIHFNVPTYIKTFEECKTLLGNFSIQLDHTSVKNLTLQQTRVM